MTKRKICALASFALMLSHFHPSWACTAVDIQAKDGTFIAGRTMEWAYDMKWQVVNMPKGTSFSQTAPPGLNLPAVNKTTQYGIIGIAPGILQGIAFIEGQNTAGLGMSGNFLPGFTTYQKVTASDKNYVSILDFGTWALGSFASVAELKSALSTMKVWYDSSLPSGPTPPDLHFVFNDKSGNGIVVEFINEQMQIHDNKVHVLTNAPTYEWHLTNLRNYTTVGATMKPTVQVGSADVTALGVGGNTLALRADYSPPSRFVRMAFLRWNMTEAKTGNEALQSTLHLLNNVDIIRGAAGTQTEKGTQWDTTQWITLKDLTNNHFYIADDQHRTNFVMISLDQLSKSTSLTKKLVTELPYPSELDASSVLQ
jgi:choloylglycine hydrolase